MFRCPQHRWEGRIPESCAFVGQGVIDPRRVLGIALSFDEAHPPQCPEPPDHGLREGDEGLLIQDIRVLYGVNTKRRDPSPEGKPCLFAKGGNPAHRGMDRIQEPTPSRWMLR